MEILQKFVALIEYMNFISNKRSKKIGIGPFLAHICRDGPALHDDGYAVSSIIVNKLVSFHLCQLHNGNYHLYLLTQGRK